MAVKVLIVSIILGLAKASAHSDNFWLSLQSDFLNIELNYQSNPSIKSRYPVFMRLILEGLWGWQPGTLWDMNSSCNLNEFQVNFSSADSAAKKQEVLKDVLDRCSPVFSKNNFLNSIKSISQKGSFHNHPFLKYSSLNFPNGLKTRALWGIKNIEKRDLIIIRPGIFATVDELIAERYLIFLLNELNNFHIVVLENSTSGDQFVNNQNAIIGGPKEAFENLYLIEQIRKNAILGPLVGKIHLMGISLGANGVLLASQINQKENYRYFDKTLLLCPVVDLPASFAVQMENGFIPYAIDWWSSRRFSDLVEKKDFELPSAVDAFLKLSPRWVKSAWAFFEKKYDFQPQWQTYLPKDLYRGDFKKDYQFYNEGDPLPNNFYVLATKIDPIVPTEKNYSKLLKGAHESVFFHLFDDGFHCSFAYAYQWKFLDRLFSAILMSAENVSFSIGRRFQLHTVAKIDEVLSSDKDKLEVRSVEITKLEADYVELLVYFMQGKHLRNGHVQISLDALSLGTDHLRYDPEAVRSYIKRYIQTKSDIDSEGSEFFIKI